MGALCVCLFVVLGYFLHLLDTHEGGERGDEGKGGSHAAAGLLWLYTPESHSLNSRSRLNKVPLFVTVNDIC